MKNIIVAQSGGPTVAINASLVGVLREAVDGGKYDRVFGALHGISGVLKEDFKELTIKDENGGFSYDKELA